MIGRVISTIWSIVLLIALVIWYSIGGWSAVFKAVLAMGGFGLCIAGLLKMRHTRKQRAVVTIPAQTAHTSEGEGKLNDVEIAKLSELHYSPLFEFGGECHIVERSIPVRVFDVKREAEVWLEQCQREYKPGKDGAA